jgi:hypothetical protein
MLRQRDHREGTQRPDDAKNESRLSRRPSDNRRETPSRADTERLTAVAAATLPDHVFGEGVDRCSSARQNPFDNR